MILDGFEVSGPSMGAAFLPFPERNSPNLVQGNFSAPQGIILPFQGVFCYVGSNYSSDLLLRRLMQMRMHWHYPISLVHFFIIIFGKYRPHIVVLTRIGG